MRLYDNPFSPFARKVRMALLYKGLPFDSVDALSADHRAELEQVNSRVEVPVLVDGDLTVVNSADIVAYLEHRYPTPPLYPANPAQRVAARAWERESDTLVDAILHDMSIWTWPTLGRTDAPPDGLLETAAAELRALYDRLESSLGPEGFLCGDVSVADLALFPHLSAVRFLNVPFSRERHPHLLAWYRRMRQLDCCAQDLEHIGEWMARMAGADTPAYETQRVKWRGDRLEWLLSRGFHDWWARELADGRVEWPRREADEPLPAPPA